jgi:hypothetical protein
MPRARRPFPDWPRAGLALLLATLLWLVVRARMNETSARSEGTRVPTDTRP